MEMFAHIREDGETQSLEAHLLGTAVLASRFAEAFGAAAWGAAAGRLHDIGKSSEAFQKRLHGWEIRVDHSTAGAQAAQKLGCNLIAFAVAGHHGGLPDGGNRGDSAEEPTLCGRLKRTDLPEYDTKLTAERPKTTPFPIKNRLEASFFIRMLYSCLVDADYLD